MINRPASVNDFRFLVEEQEERQKERWIERRKAHQESRLADDLTAADTKGTENNNNNTQQQQTNEQQLQKNAFDFACSLFRATLIILCAFCLGEPRHFVHSIYYFVSVCVCCLVCCHELRMNTIITYYTKVNVTTTD